MKTCWTLIVTVIFATATPWLLQGQSPDTAAEAGGPSFLRGDVNGDGILSQADITALIQYLQSSRMPPCADAADFDDSGTIDLIDMINLSGFLYRKGRFPAEPYRALGPDPTPDDDLGCDVPSKTNLQPWVLGSEDPGPVRREGDDDEGQVIDFIEFATRSIKGFPGETDIRIPVLLSTAQAIDGFTLSLFADPGKVWLKKIDLPSLFPGDLRPEFSPLYRDRLPEGFLARSIFMDFTLPFEGSRIPRGNNALIAQVVFGLSPELKQGDVVKIYFRELPSDLDLRPTPFNEFCTEGQSIRPDVDPRGLEIEIVPKETLFIRGDTNNDFLLNITDVIVTLRFLFFGQEIICPTSADVDDSGRIDISDVISLADFLFGWGAPPTLPYPNPGKDPTPDSLGTCH